MTLITSVNLTLTLETLFDKILAHWSFQCEKIWVLKLILISTKKKSTNLQKEIIFLRYIFMSGLLKNSHWNSWRYHQILVCNSSSCTKKWYLNRNSFVVVNKNLIFFRIDYESWKVTYVNLYQKLKAILFNTNDGWVVSLPNSWFYTVAYS